MVSGVSKVEPKKKPGRPKGTPKTGGRQKGTPNKITVEARELATRIVSNPKYFAQLEARALEGTLHPSMEALLWAYAFGKPAETLNLEMGEGLADSIREARERLKQRGA